MHELEALPGTVTIFSKTTCSYCKKAKALLGDKRLSHISILQIDELSPSVREWMLEHTEQAKTVPQIFANDDWVPGGYSNLAGLEEKGALDVFLAEKLAAPLAASSPLQSFAQRSSQNAELNAALQGQMDF